MPSLLKLSNSGNSNPRNRTREVWSTVSASKWESVFLRTVFLKLHHHLTWDAEFKLEDDSEIYAKFHTWSFYRELDTILASYKYTTIYIAVFIVGVILFTLMRGEWISTLAALLALTLLIIFYMHRKRLFREQSRMRSIMSSALYQTASVTGMASVYGENMHYNTAYSIFAQSAVLPFVCLCTITLITDIMTERSGVLICFPMAFQVYCVMRALLLPIHHEDRDGRYSHLQNLLALGTKTDIVMFLALSLALLLELFLNSNVMTFDKCISISLLSIFAAICMRVYGEIGLDLSRKEFKRKNTMMIERYKTESLFQKVLPPKITEQIRKLSTASPSGARSDAAVPEDMNDCNISSKYPIHDKEATVAFVKISLFNQHGEKVDDSTDPEIMVHSLHQIVKKFDKIIFLYNGVQKVEHVANTYLLCAGLLDEEMPNTIHPQLMLHACIALQDICHTLRLKNGHFIRITVGIHSGNVIGTVVGVQRRFFRIFGDTVNTASRICCTGIKHQINISQGVYNACHEIENLQWEKRENVSMKGKGEMTCFVLKSQSIQIETDTENNSESSSRRSSKQKKNNTKTPEKTRKTRQSRTLHAKFQAAQLYSSNADESHNNDQLKVASNRQSGTMGPRWMVQGSIFVKQNTQQSTSVYITRLQEITKNLHHKKWLLTFQNSLGFEDDIISEEDVSITLSKSESESDPNLNNKDTHSQPLPARNSLFDATADVFETRFRNEQFQRRKNSSNFFLFVLFIFDLLVFAVYSLFTADIHSLYWIIPLCLFSLSCVAYLLCLYFVHHQLRQSTHLFEAFTLILSSINAMFCAGYFELDFIHNICLLFFINLCVTFSKSPHSHSLMVVAVVCVSHLIITLLVDRTYELWFVYILILAGSFLLSASFSYQIEYKLRELFIISLAFQKDQILITKEISQLLPAFVIERMIGSQQMNKQQIIDKFNNATVFESDLVGFTKYSSTKKPSEVVKLLNHLYIQLDELCVSFGLEKIDTIGDAYICINFTGSADPILQFSLKLVKDVFNDDKKDEQNSPQIGIRIGVATGYVIGTVLGECTKRYAVFGDALNRAIKLEESSANQKILCCKNTVKRASKLFTFEQHEIGPAYTGFWLTGEKSHAVNEM